MLTHLHFLAAGEAMRVERSSGGSGGGHDGERRVLEHRSYAETEVLEQGVHGIAFRWLGKWSVANAQGDRGAYGGCGGKVSGPVWDPSRNGYGRA